MQSRFIGTGIAVVVLIAVVGYKFVKRDDAGEEVRLQMMGYLEELPDYQTHASLYNSWFDAHHETVFEEHYRMGSRRVRSSFDGSAYLDDLFVAMAVDAAAAGYEDQARSLRDLRDQLVWDY